MLKYNYTYKSEELYIYNKLKHSECFKLKYSLLLQPILIAPINTFINIINYPFGMFLTS